MIRGEVPLRAHHRLAPFVLLALASVGVRPAGRAAAEPTPELQKKINAAIDRGADWLRKQQAGDGSFGAVSYSGQPFYQVGLASLCGLALLASGDDRNDPWMLKTLEYLKARDALEAGSARTTYGTGLLIMFLTEYYRPKQKPSSDPRYAKPKTKDPCGLPKEVLAWVQELASWLVSVQREDGWWRYPHTPPPDLSNTQYALLGLRAARDCGAEVPLSKFLLAMEKTLATQQPDGEKVRRVIPATKPGDTEYAVDSGDRARGWAYQGGTGELVTGSITTAAIAVLAICRDALTKPSRFGPYTDDLDRKVGRSVQDGFAWLDRNFAVTHNPPRGAPAWHYYYLYGLERACAFAGREHVGKHDWYVEGAEYLVGAQKADGRWSTGAIGANEIAPSDLCDTAWALLFLKKASRPTVPIPAPVVTSGG